MFELFVIVATGLLFLLVFLVVMLFVRLRNSSQTPSQFASQFDSVANGLERVERSLRDEISNSRQEAKQDARSQRDEITSALKNFNDSVFNVVTETAGGQKLELTAFGQSLQTQVGGIASLVTGQLQTFSSQLNDV